MKVDTDKLLKRVWLINGLIFLVAIILSLSIIIYNFISSSIYDPDERGVIVGEEKEDADRKGLELQTIVFSTPRRILTSDIYVVSVSQRDYEIPKSVMLRVQSANEYDEGMQVNAIFIDQKKGTQKLLLENKASINTMLLPYYSDDSLQKHIFYRISLKDTDGNGRINSSDKEEYFISNLDGSNFKKIPMSKYKILEYEFSKDYKKLNFICSKIPDKKNIKEEHWDKTLLEYNIETDKIYENEGLTSLIAKAKEIMLK